MPLIGSTEDHLADDVNTLAPISMERIGEMLKLLEVNYGQEPEGDIIAGFDGNPCWIRVGGPEGEQVALVFEGRWQPALAAEHFDEALAFINDWNQENIFPRAMTAVDDRGEVVFGCDHVRDFEFGATDMQLRNELTIAITTTLSYWEKLEEHFSGRTLSSNNADADEA